VSGTTDSPDSSSERTLETTPRGDRRAGRRAATIESKRGALREGAISWSSRVGLYYLMLTFIARPYLIPSESMEPTLHGCAGCVGDRIMVDKLSYRFTEPKPGDVVVFKGPPNWNAGYKSIRSDNPPCGGCRTPCRSSASSRRMRTTWSSG
jgi:signal peptidase I